MPEAVESKSGNFYISEVPIDWPMWLEQVGPAAGRAGRMAGAWMAFSRRMAGKPFVGCPANPTD